MIRKIILKLFLLNACYSSDSLIVEILTINDSFKFPMIIDISDSSIILKNEDEILISSITDIGVGKNAYILTPFITGYSFGYYGYNLGEYIAIAYYVLRNMVAFERSKSFIYPDESDIHIFGLVSRVAFGLSGYILTSKSLSYFFRKKIAFSNWSIDKKIEFLKQNLKKH
tara:strand:+ start:40 stop:549 length:510 start_codon:yes stop_codon:yes gene_type:complete